MCISGSEMRFGEEQRRYRLWIKLKEGVGSKLVSHSISQTKTSQNCHWIGILTATDQWGKPRRTWRGVVEKVVI